jgi:DNA-binding response OmpR family regulator
MGKQILLIGCAAGLEHELVTHNGHGLLEPVAIPDLRDPVMLEMLRRAELIVMHQSAAPRDLPQICSHLRGYTNRPLMVLLSQPDQDRVAEVLEAGADDALPPTTSGRELLARIRAHLRRDQEYSAATVKPAVELGELHLDSSRHEVHVRGSQVSLTPREFELLEHLARRAGRAVRRDELLQEVWGYNNEMTTRTLDVHVGRLRQKIERDARHPEMIMTVPGVGYKFVVRQAG